MNSLCPSAASCSKRFSSSGRTWIQFQELEHEVAESAEQCANHEIGSRRWGRPPQTTQCWDGTTSPTHGELVPRPNLSHELRGVRSVMEAGSRIPESTATAFCPMEWSPVGKPFPAGNWNFFPGGQRPEFLSRRGGKRFPDRGAHVGEVDLNHLGENSAVQSFASADPCADGRGRRRRGAGCCDR
jgi:hypothetical protein